ncbi:MAG: LysM domain-containing protein [Caldilineaceae bacterium]
MALLAVAMMSTGVVAADRLLPRTAVDTQSDGFWYTVQPGDYLSRIAARFGVTVSAIVQANNIVNPNLIYVGQQLWIPGASQSTPPPSPSPTGSPTPSPTAPPSEGFWYTVQPGDYLSRIAARFGVTVSAIVQANNITNPNLIRGAAVVDTWLGHSQLQAQRRHLRPRPLHSRLAPPNPLPPALLQMKVSGTPSSFGDTLKHRRPFWVTLAA